MSDLKFVCRMAIVNKLTKSILKKIDGSIPALDGDDQNHRHRIIDPTEADFFALLGTDNGRGVASMLKAYPHFYGWKNIKSAVVYPDDTKIGPAMCWVLERTKPEHRKQTPLSKRGQRQLKKAVRKSEASRSGGGGAHATPRK